MIVHGIRASRTDDWVKRAVKAVEERWPDVVPTNPTYGYLSALRFILPPVRKRYARFFRDFYTQEIARHRQARIYILCHSNGTYSVGRCLKQFEAINIERICLAGSALPSTYKWDPLVEAKRVKAIRNDCGSSDVPVAILGAALRSLGMADVGTGGFDGFLGHSVKEVRWHVGGHGSMFKQENLMSMLRFLLDHDDADPTVELTQDVQTMRRWSRAMRFLSPLSVVLLAALVGYGSFTLGWPVAAVFVVILMIFIILLDIY
jgi:hypothetical protein